MSSYTIMVAFAVEYDQDEDILSVYDEKGKTKESLEVAEDLIIDVDNQGDLVGIELFDASKFLSALNKSITPKMLSEIEEASLQVVRYRNYVIITLAFQYQGQTIEEKLPAFSTAKYESPLLALV